MDTWKDNRRATPVVDGDEMERNVGDDGQQQSQESKLGGFKEINTPLMAPSWALAPIWMAVSSEAEWRRAKSCSAEYALRAMLVWAIDIKRYLMMNETMEIWVQRTEALDNCFSNRC